MSRDASVTLEFAGAEHTFRLGIKAWEKIQEKCDVGPEELLKRFMDGSWRIQDVRETLRQGLIYGATPPLELVKVDRLLRAEFDDLPIMQFLPVAQAVAMAGIIGAPDEDKPPGEPGAGEGEAASPAVSSASETSTDAEP